MARQQHFMDELYMLECLSLAEKGAEYVSPNPMVGAVLVKRGKIIGCGYHRQFGGAHAEVNAMRSAKNNVRGATLYVNLEPCNHFGKTPPCTKLIISSGIKEVIVGMRDPNPLVQGKGIAQLRQAGIKVRVGVCKVECQALNETFTKCISTGFPFVTLKVAQTLDGKIADGTGKSKWISNMMSQSIVHKLRARYDAVLVGAGTVINDNPQLTVRRTTGRNPIRIIIDGRFKVPVAAKVFSKNSNAKTILVVANVFLRHQNKKHKELIQRGVEVIGLPSRKNGTIFMKKILFVLGKKGITSVLVEGGASVYGRLLDEKLADKVILFIAPKILGSGIDSFSYISKRLLGNEVQLHKLSARNVKGDVLIEGYLH